MAIDIGLAMVWNEEVARYFLEIERLIVEQLDQWIIEEFIGVKVAAIIGPRDHRCYGLISDDWTYHRVLKDSTKELLCGDRCVFQEIGNHIDFIAVIVGIDEQSPDGTLRQMSV